MTDVRDKKKTNARSLCECRIVSLAGISRQEVRSLLSQSRRSARLVEDALGRRESRLVRALSTSTSSGDHSRTGSRLRLLDYFPPERIGKRVDGLFEIA